MTAYIGQNAPPLSRDAKEVIELLPPLPLATIGNLVDVTGRPYSQLRPGLDELHEAGLVNFAVLGSTDRASPRWFLTDRALPGFESSGPTWHEEANRSELLHRLPQVEGLYRVAGSVTGMGRFEDFQWLDGVSLAAAVRYEMGWAAMFWSGSTERQHPLTKRLERLAPDLLKLTTSDYHPWPAALLFVVTDPWQKELVLRAARSCPWSRGLVYVWCISEGNPPEAQVSQWARSWIYQPVKQRGLGGWSWNRRVGASPWAQPGNQALGKLLAAIAQWPDMTTKMGRQVLGEGDTGRSAQRCFTRLVQLGLAQRREEKGGYRYCLTKRGLSMLCRQDGVKPPMPRNGQDQKQRDKAHEDGLMALSGQFIAAGLPTSDGRRSWEHLGHGGIAPDGMVFLEHGPYNPGWHYVEYELSARGERRVSEKLRGYLSARRQDNFPVLVVSWNDSAEAVFQRLGRESGLRMLTTTKKRLETSGPLNHPDCWSMYGEPVTIG